MTKRFFGASILTLAAMCAALTGCPDHTPETGGGGVGGLPATESTSKGTGGAPVVVCGGVAQCNPPADPTCHEAACDGMCRIDAKPDGVPCGTGHVCVSGQCVVAGAPCSSASQCDDGNPCTFDGCYAYSGTCFSTPTQSGDPCGNGMVCNGQGGCVMTDGGAP